MADILINGAAVYGASRISFQKANGTGEQEFIIPSLQAKTATVNGAVTPDSGYDGLSSVTVAVGQPELPASGAWGGTTFTLDQDYGISSSYTIPEGYTLVIPSGKKLKLMCTSLSVNGTLTNNGSITGGCGCSYVNGVFTNNGTVSITGALWALGTVNNYGGASCNTFGIGFEGVLNNHGKFEFDTAVNWNTINCFVGSGSFNELIAEIIFNNGTISAAENTEVSTSSGLINMSRGTIEGDGWYQSIHNLGGTVTATDVAELINYQVST